VAKLSTLPAPSLSPESWPALALFLSPAGPSLSPFPDLPPFPHLPIYRLTAVPAFTDLPNYPLPQRPLRLVLARPCVLARMASWPAYWPAWPH